MQATLQLVGIIPTLNNADHLDRLFESIDGLNAPKDASFRIVVVDNSADGSARAQVKQRSLPFPCTFVHEPRQGLSRARNAGIIDLDDNDIICTIDDDIILPPGYLNDVAAAVRANPHAGVMGGRVELYDARDLPITIKLSKDRDVYTGGLRIMGFIHGCCMIIPMTTVRAIGPFDIRIGAGAHAGASEDCDFTYRVWRAGLPVIYEPSIFVYHNHGRRTEEQAVGVFTGYLRGRGAFMAKHIFQGDLPMVKWSVRWALDHRRKLRRLRRSEPSTATTITQAASDQIAKLTFQLVRQGFFRFLKVIGKPSQ